uniref:Beclin-1-like protein n=1 Tax=Parascaris univalens TaxID=6257 RepID=A0A914ZR87_PARUN
MADPVAFCLNCQAELAIDTSLYEKDSEESSSSAAPLQLQAGRVICGGEGSLPGQSGNLFDIICNSTSALWGPMCEDCTEQLLSGMDQQLKGLEEECASYRKLLDSLSKDRATRVFDLNTSNAKLVAMKAEEASLIAELKRLEMEENTLNDELSRKRSELCNAEREREEKLWKKLRDNHRRLLDVECQEQDAEAQLIYLKTQLEKLSSINVLNAAFHIWQQGSFCTINGFRLGTLPHSPVEWNEINAAWGQTALLLTVLIKGEEDFHLRDYEIFPMGNYSFIRVLATGAELPLYGSGGFKPFGQKKFDEAICAFLNCFCQWQTHIESRSEFRFPHRMYRERIEDNKMEYSVKMQFNSEERWTKAMKCMLINLRWAISFAVTLRGFMPR